MALTLYRTSRNSRLYRDVNGGVVTGFSRSSQVAMHYQSVALSGNYDTPIDVALVAQNDTDLDGYAMNEADWNFEVQTGPQASPSNQNPQGTMIWKGAGGANPLVMRMLSLSYLFWTGRDLQTIVTPDFTSAPTLQSWQRNLGSNVAVPDVNITVNQLMSWSDLFALSPEEAKGNLNLEVGLKGGRMLLNTVLQQAFIEHVVDNVPPTISPEVPANDVWIGPLYEIDTSGIASVRIGGVEYAWTDDFDDDDGDVELLNSDGAVVGIIIQSNLGRYIGPDNYPIRKRFWQDGGVNYMFFGIRKTSFDSFYDDSASSQGRAYRVEIYSEAERANLDNAYHSYFASWRDYYSPESDSYYEGVYRAGMTAQYGGVGQGYDYASEYGGGMRFGRVDVPFKASFTGPGEYAVLQMYQNESFLGYGPGAQDAQFWVDVSSSDQPAWSEDGETDTPRKMVGREHLTTKSNASTLNDIPTAAPYAAMAAVDVSPQMEELVQLPGWKPENAARFVFESNPATSPYYAAAAWWSTYDAPKGIDPIMDAYFTFPAGLLDTPVNSSTSIPVELTNSKFNVIYDG